MGWGESILGPPLGPETSMDQTKSVELTAFACAFPPLIWATWATEYQCCLAAQAEVFGLINDTHPAAAEFFQNAIVRDGLANHYFRNRSSRWMLGCDQVQVNVGTPDGCR